MSKRLDTDGDDRVLIFAPHPDDESLATGGLIQATLGAGARVRVVFATDGDNNPWPQRWLEKRWHIDPSARARWGARRRLEAAAALQVLGVGPGDMHFLGWPDQGLTGLLLTADAAALALLVAEIADWRPTRIVLPARSDHHPDHSALHLLLLLALQRLGLAACGPALLSYVVHAEDSAAAGARARLELDARMQQRKRDAIACHHSQLLLSRRRLLAFATEAENYVDEHALSAGDSAWPITAVAHDGRTLGFDMDWRGSVSGYALLIVLESASAGSLRWKLRLTPGSTSAAIEDIGSGRELGCARVSRRGSRLHVELPLAGVGPLRGAYVKLEKQGRRLMLFDRAGWAAAVSLLDREASAFDANVVAMPGNVSSAPAVSLDLDGREP